MGLSAADIHPGVISFFKLNELRADSRVTSRGGTEDHDKPRPAVCYKVEGATAYFCPITTKANNPAFNVEIPIEQVIRPTAKMRDEGCHLNGGLHTYSAPLLTWVEFSSSYDSYDRFSRPGLKPEGLAIVVEAVKTAGGL